MTESYGSRNNLLLAVGSKPKDSFQVHCFPKRIYCETLRLNTESYLLKTLL